MAGTAFSPANWSVAAEASFTNPGVAMTGFIDISTLPAEWKAAVQSDGADIRITDDENTELPLDVIGWAYNAGAPTGIIAFLWGSAQDTAKAWAGYTGGTAVAYDADEEFGSDNVYPAAELGYHPNGGLGDRTSNGNNGSEIGGVSSGGIAGLLGAATTYDGIDDAVEIGNVNAGLANVSVSVVFRSDGTDASSVLFGKLAVGGGAANDEWGLIVSATGTTLTAIVYNASSSSVIANIASAAAAFDGEWHQAGFVYNGSQITPYFDGVAGTPVNQTGNIQTTTQKLRIGCDDGTQFFTGDEQHVRYSSAAQPASWFATHWAMLSDNATFWGGWTIVSTGAAVVLHHQRMMRMNNA